MNDLLLVGGAHDASPFPVERQGSDRDQIGGCRPKRNGDLARAAGQSRWRTAIGAAWPHGENPHTFIVRL